MAAILGMGEFVDADLKETRKLVENAENQARLEQRRSNDSKVFRRNDREFARALHRQADQLYYSGDYETALVLYHRAANVFPRDSSHSVAARRTSATINSWNDPPSRGRGKFNEARLIVTLCPESAALKANRILKDSPDDPCSIAEALSYLDASHANLRRATLPAAAAATAAAATGRSVSDESSKQTTLLRKSRKCQLEKLADASLRNLASAFESGRMQAGLKYGQAVLNASAGLRDPSHYQIAAYDYLSLIHVALGRHDRAASNASRLVRLARSTGDIGNTCRSLVTLGKVHLSFGHLEAAARAWKSLSRDLAREPTALAWIYHEIGRCYLETFKYKDSLEMASKCVEAASRGRSGKWLFHGRLLRGQTLASLGRFLEAIEELEECRAIRIGKEVLSSYICDLLHRLRLALRGSQAPPPNNELRLTSTNPRPLNLNDETPPRPSGGVTFRVGFASSSSPDVADVNYLDDDRSSLGDTGSLSDSGSGSGSGSGSATSSLETQRRDTGTTTIRTQRTTDQPPLDIQRIQRNLLDKASLESGKLLEASADASSDKALMDKSQFLDALRVVKGLDKKDELELLEVLENMLLPPLDDFRTNVNPTTIENSEIENSEDGRNRKIVPSHTLYRHSLPSNPREHENDDVVFRTCEGRQGN